MSGIDFPSLLIIAISLSADCFVVALGSGLSQKNFSFIGLLSLPLLFGIFQAFMAVIGWLAGRSLVEYISVYDHWVAFGLLLVIGARMIWESFRGRGEEKAKKNLAGWFVLIVLAIATSVDSLAVGLGLAFLDVNITLASVTIGITALVITFIGTLIGKKVGVLFGRKAEAVGGFILIAIGLRILLQHLL